MELAEKMQWDELNLVIGIRWMYPEHSVIGSNKEKSEVVICEINCVHCIVAW